MENHHFIFRTRTNFPGRIFIYVLAGIVLGLSRSLPPVSFHLQPLFPSFMMNFVRKVKAKSPASIP